MSWDHDPCGALRATEVETEAYTERNEKEVAAFRRAAASFRTRKKHCVC